MIFSLNAGFLGSLCLSLSLSRLLACRTPEALDDQLERSACTLQAFKGFGGASRLVVAKPGAKGAEKHIFLIDSSRGGGPHDGCPAQAQAAPRAIFLLHFLFCLFLLRLPFGLPYHTIPLTGKAPFFFAFNYPDGWESQDFQAPRINALKCPWLFPSPDSRGFDAGTSASASNADQASTAGSGTSAVIQG